MIAPNSTRRIEPIRLSMPKPVNNGPVTQRGRCGKLGDSQQYAHITSGQGTHGNLLGAKQHLRQAISVHKVERPIFAGSSAEGSAFNPNRTDSFAVTNDGADFGDESIVGRGILNSASKKNQSRFNQLEQ